MPLLLSGAEYRPLAPKMTQPLMLAHDFLCYHTMAGYLWSTDSMFHKNGYGGTESHLGTGGKWGSDVSRRLDGETFQWVDMMYSADANYMGSRRVISVETADNAVRPIQGWTPLQIDELVRIGIQVCSHKFHSKCPSTWACRKGTMWNGIRVGIPPVMVPDTKPGRRGLAVHRQGVEHSLGVGRVPGYLVPGGVRWSVHEGKDCPTDRRVAQFKQVVIPRIQLGLLPPKPKPPAPKPPVPVPVPPKPPVPTPPPPPAAPNYKENQDMAAYLIKLDDDPAQFIADLNAPGDIQHLATTDEVARFAKVFPQVALKKDTFLRLYHVPMWEDGLPVTEPSK